MIHYTGRYSPFTIQRFNGGDVYSGERTWYSVFPSWNHWPTSQINSSGRNARFPDRAAHSSMSHLFWPLSRQQRGDVPFPEKTLMEGMTDQSAVSLVGLAKSWLQAPALETVSDCRAAGYDQSQRAYVLSATGPSPSFRIAASAERPIVNLCFVVKNWNCGDKATLEIDSRPQAEGPRFRQGIVRDPNGWQIARCVAGNKRRSLRPSRCMEPNRPRAADARPAAWTEPPRLDNDFGTVQMQAAPVDGWASPTALSAWKGLATAATGESTPLHVDAGLPPQTRLAYRVKTRDYYGAESDWSPVQRLTTAAAPPPVAWNMDEVSGTTIKVRDGRHEGVFHGPVTRVPGIRGSALRFDGHSYVDLGRSNDLRSETRLYVGSVGSNHPGRNHSRPRRSRHTTGNGAGKCSLSTVVVFASTWAG